MKTAGRKRLSALLSAAICCSVFSAYGSTAFAAGELTDSKRNIKIAALTSTGSRAQGIRYIPDKAKIIDASADLYDQNQTILKNMQSVYDFYADTLGYKDWAYTIGDSETETAEGEPGTTDPTLYGVLLDSSNDAKSEHNFIILGKSDDNYRCMGTGKDVIGHEMMHLVTLKKCHWTTYMESAETKALMEAYSDIIGELADDEADWKIGSAVFTDQNSGYSMRDIANPSATKSPYFPETGSAAIMENNLYTDYQVYMKELDSFKGNLALSKDAFNPATRGSLIVSHAAYLMNKAGIPRADLAQIWFNSLDFYKAYMPQATFIDCRRAVTNAAVYFVENQNYSADQRAKYLDAVNYGFDSAKIFANHFGYSLQYGETEIKQLEAQDASHISSFLTAEQKKYPNGCYWMTSDLDTVSKEAVSFKDYTECNGITVTSLVTDGHGCYDFISEEPYYQCAGFARKLQQDLYGTNKYIRISNEKNYTPKPGDHLRVSQWSKGHDIDKSHSVFVTAVSGNTITFADCNAGGDMKIRWNQQRTIEQDDKGRFCWSEDTEQFKFEWVERPIPLGDINGDAAVTYEDMLSLRDILNGIEREGADFRILTCVCDLDKNNKVNSTDLALLLRFCSTGEPTDQYGYIQ